MTREHVVRRLASLDALLATERRKRAEADNAWLAWLVAELECL